jgi:cell surface protein SprA
VYRSEGRFEGVSPYFWAWATLTGDTTLTENELKDLSSEDFKLYCNYEFKRLEPSEYELNAELGFIVMNQSIREDQILAVSYELRSGKRVGTQFVDVTEENAKLSIFKLIKPRNPQPTDATWDLEWRHVYSLGNRNINPEGFELKIFQKTSSGDDKEVLTINGNAVGFLQIFGLDNYDKNANPIPDNYIDNNENFLNLARGELIFPQLRPFDPDPFSAFYDDLKDNNLLNPAIYDTTDRDYIRQANKFYIEVNSSARNATFNLGMNVIESSEDVTLNGRKLTKDVDYVIDYFTGTLTMLNEDALDPAARLEINYENQQLFSVDKKTLLGIRAEYTLWESGSNRSFIGGTLLYLNQKTLDRRVRINQDAPMQNLVWDLNTAFKFEPAILDRALEALPFLHSAGQSSVSFEGEMAQVIPNPNTLNNDKTGDHNGVAYLDDFESARSQVTLSVMDKAWQFSSSPDGLGLSSRGHMIWYNPWQQVPIQDIWPERQVTQNFGSTTLTHVLDLLFYPNPALSMPSDSWFGIQQGLSTGYFDQKDKRFLEIWVQGNTGRLNIDLGRISEDAIPNRKLNTEDKMDSGIRNKLLDEGEDVGIDGVAGPDPPSRFYMHEPALITGETASPYDFWDINGDGQKQESEPWSYDNWSYSEQSNDYSYYDGTENSARSSLYQETDSEDLNGNGLADMTDDYFEYSFSLDKKNSPDTVYIAAGGLSRANGWTLYRIPLNAPTKTVGSPEFSALEYIRIWVDDVDPDELSGQDFTKITIAEISLTGNEWKLRGVTTGNITEANDDSTLSVSVINTHDNPEYTAPPGVEGVIDPVYNIRSKEQALVMILNGLAPGSEARAEKTLYQEANLLDYRQLKMFVHGGGISNHLSDQDSVAFFLRLGSGTNQAAGDYYEIMIPRVRSGWDEGNTIEVEFDTLSQMKVEMMTGNLDTLHRVLSSGQVLTVVGEPTLTRIRWLAVGIKNNGYGLFNDEIWINELRVSNVRKDKGMAWRASADIAISDLFRINGEMDKKSADFHTVNERFGQGSNSSGMSWNASIRLDKLLPSNWGVNIPVNMNYRESESTPKFLPGSDIFAKRNIIHNDSLWNAIQNISKGKGMSVSLSKRTSSRNFLVKYLLDPFSGRFGYSNSNASSSTIKESTSDEYKGSVGYKLTFSGQKYVSPLEWLGKKKWVKAVSDLKFYYLPNQISFDVQASHMKKYTLQRLGLTNSDTTKSYTQRFSTDFQPFKSLNLNFDRTQVSDLRLAPWTEVMETLEPGDVTSKNHSAGISFNPSMAAWLRPSFKYNVSYAWTNNIMMKNTDTGKSCNKNASINISGNLDLKRMVQSFGKKSKTPNQTQTRRRAPAPAEPNKQENTEGKEGISSGKKSFQILKIFSIGGKTLERIQPISISYNISQKASHNGILGEPSWGYKFDMSRNPSLRISENITQPFNIGDDRRWSLRSGLDLTSQISVNLDYSFSENENRSSQNSGSETRSVLLLGKDPLPFPNWTVNWRGLEKIAFIKKFIKSASLNHTFSGQESTTKSNGEATAVTTSRNFSPLIGASLTFSNGISSTFKYDTEVSLKEQKKYGQGTTKDESNTISVTMKYQKRGGLKLPFMKNKKLDNNIDFSMTFSSNDSKSSQKKQAGSGYVETRATSNWSLKPQMNYTFSNSVRGGLYLEFGKRKDKLTGDTSIKAFGLNTVISLAGR